MLRMLNLLRYVCKLENVYIARHMDKKVSTHGIFIHAAPCNKKKYWKKMLKN